MPLALKLRSSFDTDDKLLSVDANEVDDLCGRGETLTVEFKDERTTDDRLARAVVCLANSAGGRILLGVDDDGTIVGPGRREAEFSDPQRLVARIAERTIPAVTVIAEPIEHPEGTIVVIDVPASRQLVATTEGRYVHRVIGVDGKPHCMPLDPNTLALRVKQSGSTLFVDAERPDVSVEDLDPREFERFRTLASREPTADRLLATLANGDLLDALGVRTVTGGLTLAALLLFGHEQSLRTKAPTHELSFQVLERLAVRVNRTDHLPLLKAMEEYAERIAAFNQEDEVEIGLFRLGLPRYSPIAVRESLANALVHRDYAAHGGVLVQIEDGDLSVTSTGGFPPGVGLDNLLHVPPSPRNPTLADTFRRAGLVEKVGRGINRMFLSQLYNGRRAPDYGRSSVGWVTARFDGGPADGELAAFVEEARRAGHPYTLDELLVMNAVRHERRISPADAATALQTSLESARSQLNRLVERGLLEVSGAGRTRTYHLAASVYRRLGDPTGYVRTRGFEPLQHEQLVLNYVVRHGSIARREAAELCQLESRQAQRLLTRMRDEDKLVMEGARRTARYRAPTPKTRS